MSHEDDTIQPDYEVRILSNGVEIGLFGLFVSGEAVDVGMGVDPDTTTETLVTILAVVEKALSGGTTWYDRDGLEQYKQAARKIRDGEES